MWIVRFHPWWWVVSEPGERRVDVMAFQNFGLLMVKLVRWKSAKKRLQVLLACVHTRALGLHL